jgi:hypothetical protein
MCTALGTRPGQRLLPGAGERRDVLRQSLASGARRGRRARAQVYAASVMFGYFVRRVDKRFHLERSLGLLQEAPEDAVKRLERLFSQARAPRGPAPARAARRARAGQRRRRAPRALPPGAWAAWRAHAVARRRPVRLRDQGEGGCQDVGWQLVLT